MTSEDAKKVAKDTADRVADTVGAAASSVRPTANAASENVRDLASRASDAAGNVYDHTKNRVREAVDSLPNRSEAVAAGRRAYQQGNHAVKRQVAKQPLEAVLLAGAIGYLVGWATNRS